MKKNYFNKAFSLAIFKMIQYYHLNDIKKVEGLPNKSEAWKDTAGMLYRREHLRLKDRLEVFKYVSQIFCACKTYVDINLVWLVAKTLFVTFLTNKINKVTVSVWNFIDFSLANYGTTALDYLNRKISNKYLKWGGFDV